MRILAILYLVLFTQTFVHAQLPLFVGGVNKLQSLIDPNNSKEYRNMKGGLYLHTNGWCDLNREEQDSLIETFSGHEIVIEIGGPSKKDNWPMGIKDMYMARGIVPKYFLSNFQNAGGDISDLNEWVNFCVDISAVYSYSRCDPPTILPNFEYANHNSNHNDLYNHRVSRFDLYKKLVKYSGGLSIDSPPRVFIERDDSYRGWVMDAINYCNKNGLVSVLIVSPHTSEDKFKTDTHMMLRYLFVNECFPQILVIENYSYNHLIYKDRPYYNLIGDENQENSVMGVAKYVAEHLTANSTN